MGSTLWTLGRAFGLALTLATALAASARAESFATTPASPASATATTTGASTTAASASPCAAACAPACTKACPCGPECLPPCGVCVEHDLWLVDSRCAPTCGCLSDSVDQLKYHHYKDCCWTASDKAGFLASDDPAVVTCFVIHGNQTDASNARQFALVARKVLGKLTPCNHRLRVVMWSWPADKAYQRNRLDVNLKSPRSDAQGFYLAWLVDQMNPQVPISMVGYSLGARISAGALQILDGGSMAGRTLAARVHPQRAPLRAVHIAAAIDNDWICPGHCHGRSLNQVDYLLNLYNPADPALRFYPLLKRPRLPEALGYAGKPCCSLGENAGKYCQRSVASLVGKEHDWRDYFTLSVMRLAAPYVFRAPASDAKAAPSAPATDQPPAAAASPAASALTTIAP